MTRVALNLMYLVPGETGGMETYARELVPSMVQSRPSFRFMAFVDASAEHLFDELGDAMETIVVRGDARNKAARLFYEQTRLVKLVSESGAGLLHNLGNTGPLRPKLPMLTTIHDVIPMRVPEAVPSAIKRIGLNWVVERTARVSDRVLTDSEASAADIAEFCGVPRDSIDVTLLAARKPGPMTPAAELRTRFELGDSPLVISPSARAGHKNFAGLLRGFAEVRTDPAPLLVLPGMSVGHDAQLNALAEQLGVADRVRFLGWITDEELDGLYAAASCLAFASLIEGFGLPVLEAMERGLPAAVSNVSSIPEVAGDAALYFDPTNPGEIADQITRVLNDDELAAQLSRSGRERAAGFTWAHTAELTLDAYDRVLAVRG